MNKASLQRKCLSALDRYVYVHIYKSLWIKLRRRSRTPYYHNSLSDRAAKLRLRASQSIAKVQFATLLHAADMSCLHDVIHELDFPVDL